MLTKQERKTQKKVLEQRDEARTQIDTLKGEIERLKGDVHVLAGEEIRKIQRANADEVMKIGFERDKANRERDALLKDFDKAIAVKLDETKRDLDSTIAQLQTAQKEVMGLVRRNSSQAEEIANNRVTIDGFIASTEKLNAELASLKMEDAKSLRKRLQTKTQRVVELEQELARERAAKTARAELPVMTADALQNKLRNQLRRNGHAPQRQPVPEPVKEAPAPETPAIPQP